MTPSRPRAPPPGTKSAADARPPAVGEVAAGAPGGAPRRDEERRRRPPAAHGLDGRAVVIAAAPAAAGERPGEGEDEPRAPHAGPTSRAASSPLSATSGSPPPG